jgi:5-methyltetrahydrofolate--homocysteine methyltransferase
MPNDICAAVRERVLVCEGAMGSMLAAHGLTLRNSSEANLTHPEVVARVHRAYREAGAEVFSTNTFAANQHMLDRAGLGARAASIQECAVRICREAVGPDAFVAIGAGPTGGLLEPLGDLTHGQVVEIYRQQVAAMLGGEADFVLLETFESVPELQAAIAGVRAAGCTLPIAATASFHNAGGRTMMGDDGAAVARAMEAAGVQIVGANCGDPLGLLAAIRAMADATTLPLMAQANAGVPHLVGGQTVFDGTPDDSAELALELAALGVRIIGGCCGTTPAHIGRIAETLSGK